jgi:hypothetical protein
MPYDRVMSKEPVRILDGLFSAEMLKALDLIFERADTSELIDASFRVR